MSQNTNEAQTFEFVTIFPDLIEGFVRAGLIGKAIETGRLAVHCVDPRTFATDKHRSVDDAPFGGGAGMVMQAEPIARAIESVEAQRGRSFRVLVTPSAPRFDQAAARTLANEDHITFLCGRYEGIDDRIREQMVDACFSIGDFVLNGGEVASLAIFEAVARLREGVLGNPESIETESFADPETETSNSLLEHPHYTRPASWREHEVPTVLRSGDHEAIATWRRHAALARTHVLRRDLRPSSSQLKAALDLPWALGVLLPKDFDLAGLESVAGDRGHEVLWIGGRGRAPEGVVRVRDVREARQRLKKQRVREMRARENDPEIAGEVLSGSVWSVAVEAEPCTSPTSLAPQALADLLACEKTRNNEADALLFLVTWGGEAKRPRTDATLCLCGTRASSPQKDRNGLAIQAPLIDISQPASPQAGLVARALERSLDF